MQPSFRGNGSFSTKVIDYRFTIIYHAELCLELTSPLLSVIIETFSHLPSLVWELQTAIINGNSTNTQNIGLNVSQFHKAR